MKTQLMLGALACGMIAIVTTSAQAQKARPAEPPPHVMKQHTPPAARTAAKPERAEQKADERAENAARHDLTAQPKQLLRGIKLTKQERQQAKAIEKKYNEQAKALNKQEDAAEKSGATSTDLTQKIDALRDQERSDLRAILTSAQQTRFDANVTKLGKKH